MARERFKGLQRARHWERKKKKSSVRIKGLYVEVSEGRQHLKLWLFIIKKERGLCFIICGPVQNNYRQRDMYGYVCVEVRKSRFSAVFIV